MNQITAENSLQIQLQQLNVKMNTLLHKQDLTAATTEKVTQKTAQKAADMTQSQMTATTNITSEKMVNSHLHTVSSVSIYQTLCT